MKHFFKLASITFIFFVVGCSYNEIELPGPKENITIQETELSITYNIHTKKIIDNYCVSCHSSSGQFPALTNYSEVSAHINRIEARAIGNTLSPMPPGNPLPQNLQDTLQLWINQGVLQ